MKPTQSISTVTKRKRENVIDKDGKLHRRCEHRTQLQALAYERLALISPLLAGDVLALCANHLKRGKDLQSFCLTCKAWNEVVADNATLLIEQRQWKVKCRGFRGLPFDTLCVQGPSGAIVRGLSRNATGRLLDTGLWLLEWQPGSTAVLAFSDTDTVIAGIDFGESDVSVWTKAHRQQYLSLAVSPTDLRSANSLYQFNAESIVLHLLCHCRPDRANIRAVKTVISDPTFPEPIRRALGRWDERLT